jgi:hypothetical protein
LAFIIKKSGCNYSVDAYKVPVLDENGVHKKNVYGRPMYIYKKKGLKPPLKIIKLRLLSLADTRKTRTGDG